MREPFPFTDPAISLITEDDADAISELFRRNYGCGYPHPDVFDGSWAKHCVYNDDTIGVVFREDEKVLGTGALRLSYGDFNDQIGELARLAVDPSHANCGIGTRVLRALFDQAAVDVEFAFAEARTLHAFSQTALEEAGFAPIGFIPHLYFANGCWESAIRYGRLYETARSLRSVAPPILITEFAPLAEATLTAHNFTPKPEIIANAQAYPVQPDFRTTTIDRLSLSQLTKIKEGRLAEPLLFGRFSVDQGYSLLTRNAVHYLVAFDANGHPAGAIGYQYQEVNRLLKGIQLIGKEDVFRGSLCRALVDSAEALNARMIEVNVSAYNPRLQKTFLDLGFKPIGYAPAMVFHETERLDVLTMLKLSDAYTRDKMRLTAAAEAIVSLVEATLMN